MAVNERVVEVRAGRDAFVDAGSPAKNRGGSAKLRLRSAAKSAYLYFKLPAPTGATIRSARLTLKQEGAYAAGSVTVTARRAAGDWSQRDITWNNRPGAEGATSSVTKSTPADGATWVLDLTEHVQEAVNAGSWHGIRLTSSSAVEDLAFRSMEASGGVPVLEVEWSKKPQPPEALIPGEGAISKSHPVLQASHPSKLSHFQVQISRTQSPTSVQFDSGAVATDLPLLDLATTAFAGLADPDTTYWRCRVTVGGETSLWSDWSLLKRLSQGTLTILNPGVAPNNFVDEFTPRIAWQFNRTQTQWQVRIHDAATGKLVLESGIFPGARNDWTVPAAFSAIAGRKRQEPVLEDQRDYEVRVRVWDDKQREGVVGDRAYVQAERIFSVRYDDTVAKPVAVTAALRGSAPIVEVRWDRSTFPDSWTLLRDGRVLAADLKPEDTLIGATTHEFIDYTCDPERPHVYSVLAVVNEKASKPADSEVVVFSCVGLWLLDPERGKSIRLGTDGPDSMAMGEDAETLTPLGGDSVVRVVQGMRGLEGSVSGAMLRTRGDDSWEEYEARLMAIKSRPSETFRLVMADRNYPVLLGGITVGPHPASITSRIIKAVSFQFWQDGELPFRRLR